MHEVEPAEDAAPLLESLRRMVQRRNPESTQPARVSLDLESKMPWEDQIRIFEAMHPGGFTGDTWQSDRRGGEGRKRLKRHRNPMLTDAAEILAEERVNAALNDGTHLDYVKEIAGMLGASDLVGKAYVEQLVRLKDDKAKSWVEALNELLHSNRRKALCFTHWLDVHRTTMGKFPSWKAATVLPALLFPEREVCVHKTSFLGVAGEVAPAEPYSKSPTASGYIAMRALAETVAEKLRAAGHEPQDMLDVRDFIESTMRPSAKKHLE